MLKRLPSQLLQISRPIEKECPSQGQGFTLNFLGESAILNYAEGQFTHSANADVCTGLAGGSADADDS